MINAMIIDLKDTVAVAIEPIAKGEDVNYKVGDEVKTIKALNDVQIYHKLAIKDMAKGEPVVKYRISCKRHKNWGTRS